MPQSIVWKKEVFNFNQDVNIFFSKNTADIFDSVHLFLKNKGSRFTQDAKSQIHIGLLSNIRHVLNNEDEAYELTVSKDKILLYATTKAGLYYGFQTLKQLVVKEGLQGCNITDYPAFAIRGFMHDVGRSFISIPELKRQIALLSTYKINTFHWHLTEDIAWRLESKVVPKLTGPSVFTRFKGQFYTQAEARDLVDFCKKHLVLLIPEMDMPGHSAAFIRATGVEMQSNEGKKIVKELLKEWCDLFDVPYIHIGTDEVRIKDTAFIPEMIAVIRNCGKEVIGWQPGGKADKQVIRQMWTSSPHPQKGLKVIDSRNYYLNHFDLMADLVGVFNHNICDTSVGDAEKLGAIACIWNDRKLNTVRKDSFGEGDIILMNGFYPILLTLAERSWRGGGILEKEIGVKMQPDFKEYETRLLVHKKLNFRDLCFPYVKQANIKWRIIEPFKNGGDLSKNFPPEQGNLSFPTTEALGASVYLRHVWGDIVPSYLQNTKENSTAYAYTYVFSPKKQETGLWINFHNYGRSEKDATPPLGEWDYKKSRIWLNGQLITPPNWKNAGMMPKDLETPYEDESPELRPPTKAFLNKGWNLVLLKLPVGAWRMPEYRLVKWQFTAVFVKQNGVNVDEMEGLIYSPDKKR